MWNRTRTRWSFYYSALPCYETLPYWMSPFLSTYGKYTIFREIFKICCLDFGGGYTPNIAIAVEPWRRKTQKCGEVRGGLLKEVRGSLSLEEGTGVSQEDWWGQCRQRDTCGQRYVSRELLALLRKHRSFAKAGFLHVRRISQKAKMVELGRGVQDLPTSASQS